MWVLDIWALGVFPSFGYFLWKGRHDKYEIFDWITTVFSALIWPLYFALSAFIHAMLGY